jgi:hypothetical protein
MHDRVLALLVAHPPGDVIPDVPAEADAVKNGVVLSRGSVGGIAASVRE